MGLAGVPSQQSAPNREQSQTRNSQLTALIRSPLQLDRPDWALNLSRHINRPPLTSPPSLYRPSLPGRQDVLPPLLMAHYSSLFTLGLLSDRASPPSSPKSNIFYKFRKSSLPTRSISKPSSELYAASPSEGLPQFTNPFAATSPVSEASTELRSFLSLDLAADKSLSSNRLLSPLDTAPLHSTSLL